MRKLTHKELQEVRKTQVQMEGTVRFPIISIIDNVRSLYNIGSIFRTSDGACIEKLILTGFTPTPPRKEIGKTALGSTNTVPWEYSESPITIIKKLKSNGYKIIVVEITTSSKQYSKLKINCFPCCFVFGNEIIGVSPEIIELADLCIEIPMYGSKHSLNVAVAYGIVLFEAVRILNLKK